MSHQKLVGKKVGAQDKPVNSARAQAAELRRAALQANGREDLLPPEQAVTDKSASERPFASACKAEAARAETKSNEEKATKARSDLEAKAEAASAATKFSEKKAAKAMSDVEAENDAALEEAFQNAAATLPADGETVRAKIADGKVAKTKLTYLSGQLEEAKRSVQTSAEALETLETARISAGLEYEASLKAKLDGLAKDSSQNAEKQSQMRELFAELREVREALQQLQSDRAFRRGENAEPASIDFPPGAEISNMKREQRDSTTLPGSPSDLGVGDGENFSSNGARRRQDKWPRRSPG